MALPPTLSAIIKRVHNNLYKQPLLAMVCFFALVNTTASAAILQGTVVEMGSQNPLPDANIILTSAGSTQPTSVLTTNLDGKFRIETLPAGTYTIRITYIGYQPYEHLNLNLTQDREYTLQIELQVKPYTMENIVVQSVSRRPEKAVDAPAAVHILEHADIQARPALTSTEHIKSLPAVDVAQTGLNQTRVAVRGFNGPLTDSDKLLTLSDYRNTRVPSLRYNIGRLIPANDHDIDRIELVLGPGSALYGPNATNGVLHLLTKSPIDFPGTSVTLSAGERSLLMGSFRHAGAKNNKFGYKISGRYYQGTDWKHTDPAEPNTIVRGTYSQNGRINQGGSVSNQRDFNIDNLSVDGRVDLRGNSGFQAVLSGGFAKSKGIDITTVGAIQNNDWSTGYAQARVTQNALFAQTFINWGNTKDNYMMRTGDIIRDKSRLIGLQIQHGLALFKGRQHFTYGADAFLTRPDTEGTINGRNETQDNINETGIYLQSETEFTAQLKLVATARIDDHNHLQDRAFSPRIALVIKPQDNHSFRFTYNRAFTTPPNSVLFLDLNLSPTLGGLPIALRGVGVSKTGYTFRKDAQGGVGGLYMQSPFLPPAAGGPSTFLPADASIMWGAVVGIMAAQGVDLTGLPSPTPGQVGTVLGQLNTATQQFDLISPNDLVNISPFEPTITNAFEMGYKGLIGTRLIVTADAYYNKIENFVHFDVQTPNVVMDPVSLTAYLAQFLPPENAAALAGGIAAIPVGTIVLQEPAAQYPADIVMTYQTFTDNISLYGLDLSANLYANNNWKFGSSYSYVSKDFFEKTPTRRIDIALNAPKHKISAYARYNDSRIDIWGRLRYIDAHPIEAGVYSGQLPAYSVIDLTASYKPVSQTRITLSVQNLLNNKHQEFIGTPKIGRLSMLSLTQTF